MLGVGLMHWAQSNDDSYLKINTCYHLNKSKRPNIRSKPDPTIKMKKPNQ